VWFSQSWLILKVFITFLVIGYLIMCKKLCASFQITLAVGPREA